ncbi:globin domain-containing protein [Streptomyces sp. NPDC048636]|uniref:globin domain-containing protein n=1 Tax=Streptomyces sp. NPDC048636 TaxID=3155762 RepID=UPI003425AA9D
MSGAHEEFGRMARKLGLGRRTGRIPATQPPPAAVTCGVPEGGPYPSSAGAGRRPDRPVASRALSERTRGALAESLPEVGAAIGEITRGFYASLFREHPELLNRMFNRGNQATGEQQDAIASALIGFASLLAYRPYIRPEDVLNRIAHKHASVGVVPGQYKVVERHLLGAMSEVLGSGMSSRVEAAWREVYWIMADTLMAREEQLYVSARAEPVPAWRHWRVVRRTEEAHHVRSFWLQPADGAPPPPFLPGQYVTVAVELPDGALQLRQYSLTSAPGDSLWRITVRRVQGTSRPPGEVSSFLHERIGLGDILAVSPPYGEVVLDDSTSPLLFASYGIGLTPFVSMLRHLVDTGSPRLVTVVHNDRCVGDHPLRFEVEDCVRTLGGRLLVGYEDRSGCPSGSYPGPVDLASLTLPHTTRAYLCGPVPFLRAARLSVIRAGVTPSSLRYEVFGPDMWQAPS